MFRSIFKFLSVFILSIFASSLFIGCGGDSVNSPKLVDMEITPASTYVVIGGSEQFIATGIYDDGSSQNITGGVSWRTIDSAIATINSNGVAYGLSEGSTTVIAAYNNGGVKLLANAHFDVSKKEILDPSNPSLKSVKISGSSSVAIGKSTQLNAIATLTDSTTYLVNDKANWSSSDTSVATVDANGLVNANGNDGSVVITARGKKSSSIVATHSISVVSNQPTIDKIQIELGYNPNGGTVITSLDLTISETEYVTAWAIYSDGSRVYKNTEVVWWSSDQQVATINTFDSSEIYGRDVGTAQITAKLDGKEGRLNVTVVKKDIRLESIEIDADGIGTVTGGEIDVGVGNTQWLTAYGHYSDGSRENINSKVFYSSSNSDIAYVIDEKDSNVHGRSVGTATINVDWQGIHSDVRANVYDISIDPVSTN